MAENSTAETLGKLTLGVGVGFGLYWLIRNFGFGGFGLGGGRGDSRSDGGSAPSRPGPALPPRPKDAQPLFFWMEPVVNKPRSKQVDPVARTRDDARFYLWELGPDAVTQEELHRRLGTFVKDVVRGKGTPMSVDEVVERIKAGGRDDVRLDTSGATIQGTWDDAKDALMAAGIKHWILWKEAPADRKPGKPPTPARWELFSKGTAADLNPDKNGHYHFEQVGTAYWNLRKDPEPPHVSGNPRGHYGRPVAGGWR
jgi:hypothetical protein